MADDDQQPAQGAAEDPARPEFTIQKIYVKDVSFESPATPDLFLKEWKPQTNVQLNTEARRVSDDVHEVVLTLTVTTKTQDETAYLVEVKQAGVFTAKGFPPEQLGHLVGAYCPNLLFPYARETISSLVLRGGFPDMPLAPVNFDALYAQHLESVQRGEAGGEPAAAPEAAH
jgi:preprotein translocase subunit SecB